MPQKCRACASSEREEIDKALAIREPLRNIAKRYGTSPAALLRHRKHVGAAIQRASERRETDIGDAVLDRLESLYERGQRIMDKAEASGDAKTALRAIGELRGLLAGFHQVATDAARQSPPAGEHRSPCPFCNAEQYEAAMIAGVSRALGLPDAGTLNEPRQPLTALPAEGVQ